MRRAATALVVVLLVLMSGCSTDIKAEVRALHKAHQTWRANTIPKPELSDADKKKVIQLGEEIEKSFIKLEALTE